MGTGAHGYSADDTVGAHTDDVRGHDDKHHPRRLAVVVEAPALGAGCWVAAGGGGRGGGAVCR